MNIIIAGLVGVIGGLLGAYGGACQTSKNWRRLGIPILLTVISLCFVFHWLILSILTMIAVLCIGYGIPDIYGDEGSPLGRFYFRLFNDSELYANIFTRGTVALLACLTLIYIPILSGEWIKYTLSSVGIIAIFSILSWRSLGSVYIINKWLIWAEVLTYGALSLGAMLML